MGFRQFCRVGFVGLGVFFRSTRQICNGTPVGTSELFLGAGVAGIHGVTTLPEYRGRGIATAMTYAPLLHAREQGYRVGVLFSSEMAIDIYRKMGFQEYGQGDIYMWQPEEDSP